MSTNNNPLPNPQSSTSRDFKYRLTNKICIEVLLELWLYFAAVVPVFVVPQLALDWSWLNWLVWINIGICSIWLTVVTLFVAFRKDVAELLAAVRKQKASQEWRIFVPGILSSFVLLVAAMYGWFSIGWSINYMIGIMVGYAIWIHLRREIEDSLVAQKIEFFDQQIEEFDRWFENRKKQS
jgi:signal transduction histidine kinase